MSVAKEHALARPRSRGKHRFTEWLLGQNSLLYGLADILAIAGAGFLCYFSAYGSVSLSDEHGSLILAGVLIALLVFTYKGLLKRIVARGFTELIRAILGGWLTAFVTLLVAAFVTDLWQGVSNLWALAWSMLSLLLLLTIRIGLVLLVRAAHRRGIATRRVVVIGEGDNADLVIEKVGASGWAGVEIVGVLADTHGTKRSALSTESAQQGFDGLPKIVEDLEADEVWICPDSEARSGDGENRVVELMTSLQHSMVNQRLFPEVQEMRLFQKPVSQVMGLPVLNLTPRPHDGWDTLLKAVEDRLLALMILVFITPLMIAIAAWIKLDSPGPVLFKQKRHGVDGKLFTIYKFRSMYVHQEPDGVVTQAKKEDARVTKVGAFIRRTSLDELPQFINVLQGRMSIVGPRPHPVTLNEYFMGHIQSYMQRHRVKPGITGWAQINGFRGETPDIESMRQRINLDLYYIENWSIWFDLKIIARTILSGFSGENAY